MKVVFISVLETTEYEEYAEIRPYVLYLDNGMRVGERTLGGLFKSMHRLIQLGEKNQPRILIRLLEGKSTIGFHGVAKFDHVTGHHHVPSLLSKIQYDGVPSSDCWRLPVVTLTAIAVSLPKIGKDDVEYLLKSVKQGLVYVKLVEESLNGTYDHVRIQKAADTLWNEIEIDHKWLGHKLRHPASQEYTEKQVVECFLDNATNLSKVYESTNNDSIYRFICADSMHRITETILRAYHTNIDAPDEELFETLLAMIADIIAACLTNLPQIITMKCHTSVREERQERVKDAAQLLGETRDIINFLQDRDIPNIYPSDMPFVSKWRAYFEESLIP